MLSPQIRALRFSIPVLLPLLCSLTTPRPASAQNVRVLKLRANDIVYDAKTKRIFASVPSSEGRIGNSILRLDPATGGIGPAVFVGSEPGKLALSSGSQFLYVALDGAAAVRRYDMATQTAGPQFMLGRDPSFGPYYAGDIAAVPGSPDSIAVNRILRNNGGQGGLVIYDNGVPRGGTLPYPAPSTDSLAFASASRLYSFENVSTFFRFSRLNVSSSGVTLQDSAASILSGFQTTISLDGGLVFATNGQVLNPESLELIGRFSPVALNTLSGSPAVSSPVVSDAARNRVYFLTQADNASATLLAFDRATFLPVGALTVPGLSGKAASLIRWGSQGLAFRTARNTSDGTLNGGQVVLVDSTELPGLRSLTINSGVVGGASAIGTVTLTQPAPPVGVRVQLSSTNPQAATAPPTVLVPAGKLSATFPITSRSVPVSVNVLITATWGAQTRQSRLTVLNSAQTPVYGPQIQTIALLTGDLAFDKNSGKIYASLPSAAGDAGNSLATIDPVTGATGTPVFVGSEPGKLAVSGDGQFVYVGLDGAAAVRRFDTATGTRGLRFSLGRDDFLGTRYAKDILVLPGDAHALAVSRSLGSRNSGQGGVAVYDDGIQRAQATSDTLGGDFLAFGNSAARLYGNGYNGTLYRLSVSRGGVATVDNFGGVISGPIKFDSGLLYGSEGRVVDPETLTLRATLGDQTGPSLVAPDVARGRIYLLTGGVRQPTLPMTLFLKTYDATTFQLLSSLAIADVYGSVDSLIVCGPNRVAFRTYDPGHLPFSNDPYNGTPHAGQVFLATPVRPAALRAFAFSPATVRVGSKTVGTATLDAPAPAGGATVTVKSGSTVLGTIVVNAGQTTGTLTLTAHVPGSYTVSATLNGVTKTTPLTVTP